MSTIVPKEYQNKDVAANRAVSALQHGGRDKKRPFDDHAKFNRGHRTPDLVKSVFDCDILTPVGVFPSFTS
jgi:hypothetical protein